MKICLKYLLILISSLNPVLAQNVLHSQQIYDLQPWAATYYAGISQDVPLVRLFRFEHHRWPENVQALEIAHTLNPENAARRFFAPFFAVVQFAINTAFRQGRNQHNIYELNPYFAFRCTDMPWQQYVETSFAIGEGVSYATSVPKLEKKHNYNTKRFLNYLMFEATFALPAYPRLQLVARIHHRSGAYGLYGAGNTGSNNVGLGLRYLFG